MKNYRQPIIISPRLDSTNSSTFDLFSRFERYGLAVNVATDGEIDKLIVLGNVRVAEQKIAPFNHLDYRFIGEHPIAIFFRVRQVLKLYSSNSITLIAGDLWFGGSILFALKCSRWRHAKMQISFHGVPNLGSNYFSSHLRMNFLKNLIGMVDSVRVVSHSLEIFLQRTFGLNPNQSVIAPIPIILKELVISDRKSIRIGVIGRLHPERGLDEALQILDGFTAVLPPNSIYFLGDGPLRGQLLSWSAQLPNSTVVRICGAVSNEMVLQTLGRVQVLLSCAPDEGYGLALREGLLSGAYVVARRNEGTIELFNQYPESVFLFNNIVEARKMIENIFDGKVSPSNVQNVLRSQKYQDEKSLSRLSESWVQ